MHSTTIDEIDLSEILERLRRLFHEQGPNGYLDGKTSLRNALEQELGCSELAAETLVDTLESRGVIHFLGDPADPAAIDAPWHLG
jgi:hypothetical protein